MHGYRYSFNKQFEIGDIVYCPMLVWRLTEPCHIIVRTYERDGSIYMILDRCDQPFHIGLAQFAEDLIIKECSPVHIAYLRMRQKELLNG